MPQMLIRLVKDDAGQDLIEYGLLGGFVSLVVILAVTNLGQAIDGIYNNVDTQVQQIPTGGS
jgi:Flp pilus assembly pilin Flp